MEDSHVRSNHLLLAEAKATANRRWSECTWLSSTDGANDLDSGPSEIEQHLLINTQNDVLCTVTTVYSVQKLNLVFSLIFKKNETFVLIMERTR